MIFYFSFFGIKIIEFLSFSEIVTSFLDDLNVLIIFCVVCGLHTGNEYIGKTEYFIFVFNYLNVESLVIPMSEVISVKFYGG